MSLADALNAERERSLQQRQRCQVRHLLLEVLEPEDAEALRNAMANAGWPSSEIARALQAEGFQVSSSSIRRHRRGDCNC